MDRQRLEEITNEICEIYDIYAPPIPVETMLREPVDDMWEEVDVAQLSGSFMILNERFSPRMSLSRLLVRHIAASRWGQERGIHVLLGNKHELNAFARMLLMPAEMVEGLTSSMRNPQIMSNHFEVPESEALERILELA